MATKIAIFKGKKVRKTIHNNEWWFSVVDVVSALTDSENPRDYWYKMKIRENKDAGVQLSTICLQLKLESLDGKFYETDCANTEGIFRIIQSIPSPKAEPFKRWLARVGYERVKEIEDPELATKRTRAKRENLRDHMTDLELIFSMLGEASTAEIAKAKDAKGFAQNKKTAQEGGEVAGKARKDLEKKTGKRVSTPTNYLRKPQDKRLLK